MSQPRRNRRVGRSAQKAQSAAQPQPDAPQQPVPVEVPEPALVLTHDVNAFEQHVVDERALLGLMDDWRKGRATKNLWQALSDAYIAVFAIVMIVAMVVSSLIRAQSLAADCSTDACSSGRGLLPWAATFGVLAFTLAIARMFGPVLASAAEGFWLMEAPVSRRRLLGRRLLAAVLIALVSGAVLGALVATLTGSAPGAIVAWTLACGLGAGGLTALAAAEQGAERTWRVKLIHSVMALAAMAALLLVVATAAGWLHPVLGRDVTELLALVVAGIGLVMLIASSIIANHRIDRIRRARLVAGGNLVSGMQGAAFALDFALMRDILVTREANERGHVKPTRGRSTGLQALVMRDVQRLHRFPRPLLTLLASAIVPYAMQALGLGRLTIPISALVLLAALVPFFNTLRVLSRSNGLARMLPFTTSQIRTAASVVPAVLALLWAILITPAIMGVADAPMIGAGPLETAMIAVVTAAAGFVGAIRWVSAKPANYQAPMVSTQMGALPPGMIFNLVRGFDMVAIITLPALLGWSVWISIVLAVICFSVLRMGGIDQEELAAMQEENRKQMEQARATTKGGKPGSTPNATPGQKIKVTRGR
ncbi:ABC transporter permease [Tessaracoccus sp. SD287]|uniref:DUF6297 family protein n=1 Tax=Tessaracoccus sp. SD287 TaxID=2782008 RepID=UPI001A97C0C3|nr:ABC transporter permease [Tessaracoccus sp. SD287]